MNKWIALLALCLLLTGCAPSGATQPTAEQAPPQTTSETVYLTIYTPNDSADGLLSAQVEVEAINEHTIVQALTNAQVLTQDVQVHLLEAVTDSEAPDQVQLHVDFNTAFAALLQGQGTSGEYVILGSVVNTFLMAYDAQAILITVEGSSLETGHNVYDAPLELFQ